MEGHQHQTVILHRSGNITERQTSGRPSIRRILFPCSTSGEWNRQTGRQRQEGEPLAARLLILTLEMRGCMGQSSRRPPRWLQKLELFTHSLAFVLHQQWPWHLRRRIHHSLALQSHLEQVHLHARPTSEATSGQARSLTRHAGSAGESFTRSEASGTRRIPCSFRPSRIPQLLK
jgi:hypothetical protein